MLNLQHSWSAFKLEPVEDTNVKDNESRSLGIIFLFSIDWGKCSCRKPNGCCVIYLKIACKSMRHAWMGVFWILPYQFWWTKLAESVKSCVRSLLYCTNLRGPTSIVVQKEEWRLLVMLWSLSSGMHLHLRSANCIFMSSIVVRFAEN